MTITDYCAFLKQHFKKHVLPWKSGGNLNVNFFNKDSASKAVYNEIKI